MFGQMAWNDGFQRVLREDVGRAQESQEEGKQPVWYWGDEWKVARGASAFSNWCQRGLGRGMRGGVFLI